MNSFCSECGRPITPGIRFCGGCGTPVAADAGVAVAAAQQPQYAQQQPQYTQQQQFAPPQGASVTWDKQAVLANAPGALNRADRPWEVAIEGDSIVARWKWMDATFFSLHEINDETKQFTFVVTLSDKRTWKELDKTKQKSGGVKMSGGKLSFGSSSNSFRGKTNQKSFQLGLGKDNQTGEAGLIGFKFNTSDVKQPVRDYLISCGWKQAGLFG
ncbi:MAG: zinc ribbon domain-containing protein [Clostridiales bacterium]|nr:zinc ribbon domain-containing protein [Clostridiales bacterium]